MLTQTVWDLPINSSCWACCAADLLQAIECTLGAGRSDFFRVGVGVGVDFCGEVFDGALGVALGSGVSVLGFPRAAMAFVSTSTAGEIPSPRWTTRIDRSPGSVFGKRPTLLRNSSIAGGKTTLPPDSTIVPGMPRGSIRESPASSSARPTSVVAMAKRKTLMDRASKERAEGVFDTQTSNSISNSNTVGRLRVYWSLGWPMATTKTVSGNVIGKSCGYEDAA